MKVSFFLLFCVVAIEAVAEKQPFDRYQSIIDRHMFGEPPPDFDPEKMPSEVAKSSRASGKELTQEQARLQSSVHFSVINVAADGTPVVGFSDKTNPKAPVHHYIKVGEESGGWKVLNADMAEKTMTIEKDGVELTLKLGANSDKPSEAAAATPAVSSAFSGRGSRRSPLLGTLGSRRAMRERQARDRAEAEKKEREEAQAREEERAQREEAQREQERQRHEELRQQLQAVTERLNRQREERNANQNQSSQSEGQEDANNDAE